VPAMVTQLLDNPLKAELEKLSEHDFRQAIEQKELKKNDQVIIFPGSEMVEVDLHIHELLDNFNNLTNTEMLTVQMNKFHEELAKAINSGVKKIVFIHGVGNGTLKNELRRELQRKYSKYTMQDASFREYGYGATMVILKK
jgi:dsDNA-specific endonuclease/ATPase MutS2